MSGIVGSKLNIRGSGTVAKLGTDGQYLLSSGAGKKANYETVASATYDDNKIQSNIALLGFKTAVNGSLAKYNLQDQIIDEYEDASGIDASASTGERLTSGVYDGITTATPTDFTGSDSVDTSVSGYKIHVLSSASGSLVVADSLNVDILVVGGGGSGGSEYGGGGGAGGLIYKPSHALTAQTYTWVVGAGGAAKTSNGIGNVGADSTWTDASASVEFTAKGGGYGGASGSGGGAGGSGGASGYSPGAGADNQSAQSGDSGTYGFGFDGGDGSGAANYNPGGGGGAGGAGDVGDSGGSGLGGVGKDMSAIFGTAVGENGWFASGGGGGYSLDGVSAAGEGGVHGGGSAGGGNSQGDNSSAADANTGGGSGGGASGGGDSGAGGSGIILVRHATSITVNGDLTLQSTANTASSAATKADLIMLMENSSGTATINTDIKGYVTADGGSNWTEGTLVDEGSWGTNKKILAFHDATVTSGTDMRYKITTHNQSAGSKVTKIHATSLGWKA
jgi:hypothetical protein